MFARQWGGRRVFQWCIGDGVERGKVGPFEAQSLMQKLSRLQQFQIALPGRADDELGG